MAESTVVSKPPSVLVSLAKQLVAATNEVERAEEVLKTANKKKFAIEAKLVDEMKTEQVKSMRIDGLGGFREDVKVCVNVLDKEVLNAYVEKNKKKLGFLYTMHIHGSKLNSYVRECLEKSEEVPPGTDSYLKPVIRRFK